MVKKRVLSDWDEGFNYALITGRRDTIKTSQNTQLFRLGFTAGLAALKQERLENLLLQKGKDHEQNE